jgi:hypothetical protein
MGEATEILSLNESLREKHGADEGRWELKKEQRISRGNFPVCSKFAVREKL